MSALVDRFPRGAFEIPDLDGQWVVVRDLRYSYKPEAVRCPRCNGLGWPWQGWFSCDSCPAVAWIETGEVVVPLGTEPLALAAKETP